MNIELDHGFVCASPSAPEAEEFVRFGLHEGLPNPYHFVLARPKEWSRAEFSQVERERSRFSKLNSTASGEIRWRTLGAPADRFSTVIATHIGVNSP
jgi:hypothetical protein